VQDLNLPQNKRVVKMSCQRPDQAEPRKPIECSDEKPLLMICKRDNLVVLSELLSERVLRQKRMIRGKYMNSSLPELVSGAGKPYNNDSRSKPITPVTVLQELFELLEDYSPVWYTQENHDRALVALGRHP
jgi:hypothetical protein